MMTIEMIWADLSLRGWELSGAYLTKHIEERHHAFISPDAPRVSIFMAKWPLTSAHRNEPPTDEQLRRMHDIIVRYERGDYEPRQDGSTPNVARVDSTNAPERLGIQNDRPEYGGVRYDKQRYARYRRR